MNDEVRQIHDETFSRIILGLVVISLALAALALITSGVSSAWFVWAIILFVAAIVALVVRFTNRLVVASYLLVLELLVLGISLLFRSDSSFAPYVFIPIVLISGLLLNPTATLVITTGIILAVLIFAVVAGQVTAMGILLLLPSLGITFVTALLAIQNKRNLNMLGQRLLQNRIILRERTLETMETLKRVEKLQQQVVTVEKQLQKVQAETQRGESAMALKNNELYLLMQGALKELNTSVRYLEHSFEELNDLPYANGYAHSLEAIWQRVYRLRIILVNLEEMAKIEHGQIKLHYDLVNVSQLIAEVAGTAKGLILEKNIEIRTRLQDNMPAVQADPARLRQVLLHLVNNAIKYTDNGNIEIGTKVEEDKVIIQVSDTGIGMHREETERVFEKFSRGDSALAKQRQGVGLGLSISKQLVNLQGGRMWVSSVLGVGTTVYIALPARPVTESASTSVTTAKTTRQFEKVETPVLQTASSAAAVQTIIKKDNRTTVATQAPTSSPATSNDGATVILPDNAQKKTKFSDNGNAVILRRQTNKTRQPRNATGPVQRFMPFYIQRFGYILLSLLLVVVVTVAALATVKYLFTGYDDNTTLALSEESQASESFTALSEVATHTPTSVTVAFSIKETSTPLPTVTPVATEIAIILPSDTPTQIPPTATSTPLPTNTSAPEPSVTPLPPTATPSPIPTFTSTPLPTNTPTTIPTEPIETTVTRPLQLLFAAGQQLVSGLTDTEENDVPANIVPDANSRVSKSNAGQVVFATTNQGGSRDIFVSADDGGEPVNISNAPGDDIQPAWSPDGQRVAFSSGRTGNFDIFVVGADGSNPVQLTNSRAFDEWPVWSPDGNSITFVSDRDGNVELYIMNTDGSNPRRLTNHPADDWPAAWSPDGQRLVFASNRDGNWNLYVISAEGGPAFRLTNAPGDERDPIWSPDGRSIAFVHNGNDNFDVYTLPVPPGGTITEVTQVDWTQITKTPIDERYPVWETPNAQLP